MIRSDDLQYHGLILYQDTALPCFSEDAVLLARFLTLTPRDTVADLGAGNGVISILGAGITGASFTCIERQEALCALARRSIAENGQEIAVHQMDVSDAPSSLGHGTFTAAVMNPPYFAAGDQSPLASRAAARHDEGHEALEAFLGAAFLLLKNGGRLFCCYPASDAVTLFCALRRHRLEPKRLRPAAPSRDGKPRRLLVMAKKDGGPGLVWD